MRPAQLLLTLGLSLTLAGCHDPSPTTPENSPIETLADEYLAAWMEQDSLMGTYYSIEGSRHDRLPDNSLAGLTAWQQKKDAWCQQRSDGYIHPAFADYYRNLNVYISGGPSGHKPF